MKRLVAEGPKKCSLVEVEKPQITKDNQVLIKIKYSGVCMSEHYNWSTASAGMSFGHEPMGIVEAVGVSVEVLWVVGRLYNRVRGEEAAILWVIQSRIHIHKH